MCRDERSGAVVADARVGEVDRLRNDGGVEGIELLEWTMVGAVEAERHTDPTNPCLGGAEQ